MKIGGREARVDVTVTGYLTPEEVAEVITDGLTKDKKKRQALFLLWGLTDLTIHYLATED